MTRVRGAPEDSIRLLWFLKFDQRAPPDDVESFKREVIASPGVLHSVDLEGPFDFIAEVELPDFSAYHAFTQTYAEPLSRLTDYHQAGFICRRYIRDDVRDDKALWIPIGHGVQRIAFDRIDRVSAERDYVRVHVGTASYLVHSTMTAMERRLGPARFLRLHRSELVRAGFIDGLDHRGQRWWAVLQTGERVAIARSHATGVLAVLRIDSSMPNDGSRTDGHSVVPAVHIEEYPSRRSAEKVIIPSSPASGDAQEGLPCSTDHAAPARSPQSA